MVMNCKASAAITGTVLIAALLVTGAFQGLGAEEEAALLQQAQAVFQPLPQDMGTPEFPTTPARVALGHVLFFDPRWTVEGNVSCATCHQPALYGTDARAKSIGVHHRTHPRHAPTVLNAALNFVQHWWGDRTNAEEQAMQALVGVFSSGQPDAAAVLARIKAIGGYTPLFQHAFPGEAEPITAENIGMALGAYERTLTTPAPFDAFLRGDVTALPPMARAGLQRFMSRGCVACHNGVGIGGQMFQKFGVVEEYWKATGSQEIDQGRFGLTKDPADLYVFKVPSLRNVAMTPPYFHDGSVATLEEAVKVMARVQLGRTLTDDETQEMVAFLRSLTGPLPSHFATVPVLPPGAVRHGERVN
jgi:cytochrome c peroxidase